MVTPAFIRAARAQHRALYRQMAAGGTWSLYRIVGSGMARILRDDKPAPLGYDLVLSDVQARSEHSMTAALK